MRNRRGRVPIHHKVSESGTRAFVLLVKIGKEVRNQPSIVCRYKSATGADRGATRFEQVLAMISLGPLKKVGVGGWSTPAIGSGVIDTAS